MNWPTIASIAILRAITLLRDKPRALTALITVTPINLPCPSGLSPAA